MAVQNMATMNHHFLRLSRNILVLRAAYKEVLPLLRQVRPEELTWGMLAGALDDRDAWLARMMEKIVEDEEFLKAQEEEEERRLRGEL